MTDKNQGWVFNPPPKEPVREQQRSYEEIKAIIDSRLGKPWKCTLCDCQEFFFNDGEYALIERQAIGAGSLGILSPYIRLVTLQCTQCKQLSLFNRSELKELEGDK